GRRGRAQSDIAGLVFDCGPADLFDVRHWCGNTCDQNVVDKEVVDIGADDAANQRPNDRNPEVVVDTGEGIMSPTGKPGEDSWTEITRRVDRISSVRTEGNADRNHDQTNDERTDVPLGRHVKDINDRKDQ